MFTGIIEAVGTVMNIEKEGDNIHFTIQASIASETYIDQSISHNGVCLTVVEMDGHTYTVTAIKETLNITNLKKWRVGTMVNLERSMLPNTRLDGHFVQGHTDTTTHCTHIEVLDGSWYFTFTLPPEDRHLIVNKGSVAINGTSLTVIYEEGKPQQFKVAIIPYTYEHTNFKEMQVGDLINLEYDILGKYIARHIGNYIK